MKTCPNPPKGPLMNITDAAIEAASLALHYDACTDDEHDACDCSDWAREAKVALDAALPYLQPTVPNTVDAVTGGEVTMPYYSDDALAKQAALAALPDGAVAPLSMLLGICEPRVKPTDAERCNCCGLDARDSEGGEAIKRWCFICIGRGHHEDDE